jgi:hypothetical protein
MNLIGNNNNYNNLKCVVRFVPIVGEYIVKIVITVSIIMMIIFSAHNGGSIVAYATMLDYKGMKYRSLYL